MSHTHPAFPILQSHLQPPFNRDPPKKHPSRKHNFSDSLLTMTLLQSLMPTNFAKQPSKKFERKHRQYLKNKKAVKIVRLVDQLMMEQLARQAKMQLSLSSNPTSDVDALVTRDPNIGNDSNSSSVAHNHQCEYISPKLITRL
jgi:hypothetical protein